MKVLHSVSWIGGFEFRAAEPAQIKVEESIRILKRRLILRRFLNGESYRRPVK
jgi:hypothetical protein